MDLFKSKARFTLLALRRCVIAGGVRRCNQLWFKKSFHSENAPKQDKLVIDQRYVMPLDDFKMKDREVPKIFIPKSDMPYFEYKDMVDDMEKTRSDELMKQLSNDIVARTCTDDRSNYFDKSSPDYMPLGSLVLLEYCYGRSKPELDVIVGYYVKCANRGNSMMNMKVVTKILGSLIYYTFPVYCPSLRRIKIINKGDVTKEEKYTYDDYLKEAKELIDEGTIRQVISDTARKDGTFSLLM